MRAITRDYRKNDSKASGHADWRRGIRRSISWALLVKLIALIALWAIFFSPSHRVDMTAERVDSRLVIDAAPEKSHD